MLNTQLQQSHILNNKSFYTQEDLISETKIIIEAWPIEFQTLSICLNFYNTPESLNPFATANIKACQIESISFTDKKDFGKEGARVSNNLSDLEQSYRKKAVEDYLETNYINKVAYEGAFVYDRLRFTDDIIEPEKISTSVNEVFKEVLPETGISQVTGRTILIPGDATGREVVINKQAEFSKEYSEGFLLRSQPASKIGFHIIAIPRIKFKQAIESLESKAYCVIMLWLYPKRDDYPKELRPALKQVKKFSYVKRSEVKKKALFEIINIIIDNEDEGMNRQQTRAAARQEKKEERWKVTGTKPNTRYEKPKAFNKEKMVKGRRGK